VVAKKKKKEEHDVTNFLFKDNLSKFEDLVLGTMS
jgi:hypothetical protein